MIPVDGGTCLSGGGTITGTTALYFLYGVASAITTTISFTGTDNHTGDTYVQAQNTGSTLTVKLGLGNGGSVSLSVESRSADGRYAAKSTQRERRLYLPAWALTEAVKPLPDLAVTARPGTP